MDDLVMTVEGIRALEDELDRLVVTGRAEIAERLRLAHELAGDLDDNGEYLEAKDEQERLEQRIAVIEQQLRRVRRADPGESPAGEVALGRYVILEDLDRGERERLRLVGSPEADPARGWLSIASPVGQAIIGHHAGETVRVQAPHCRRRLKILAVRRA